MFALTDQARARRQGIVYGTAREVVPNRTAHMSIRDAAEAGRFAVGPASFQPVPETEEAANTAYRPSTRPTQGTILHINLPQPPCAHFETMRVARQHP